MFSSPRMRASSPKVTRIVVQLSRGPAIQCRVFPQPASAHLSARLHSRQLSPEVPMRRIWLAVVLIACSCAPYAALAQRQAPAVIGFLSGRSPGESASVVEAFRQGLNDAGYAEGQSVVIEFRWANGQYDRLQEMASELVSRQVALIIAAGGDRPVLAAKAATSTIPIVFTGSDFPVRLGLVASLNRPGGNVTGAS